MATRRHFVVEFTVEVERPNAPPYRSNKHLDVLCSTAERALEMMREQFPSAVVHVVRSVGSGEVLIDAEDA